MHAPGRMKRALSVLKLIRSKRFRARVPWRSFVAARKETGRR
jgi:hypothetical protein